MGPHLRSRLINIRMRGIADGVERVRIARGNTRKIEQDNRSRNSPQRRREMVTCRTRQLC